MTRRSGLPRREIDITPLLESGNIVTLSIGRWRAEQRLLPEDVGLDKQSGFVRDFMSLGRKSLIPPHAQRMMKSVEHAARGALKKYVLDTPFGLFTTAEGYLLLDDEMKTRKLQWFDCRDRLVKHLDSHEEEVRKAYHDFAKELFERTRRKGGSEAFARGMAAAVVDAIPTKQQIRDSFYFDLQAYDVPVPRVLKERVRSQILDEEKSKKVLEAQKRRLENWENEKKDKLDTFVDNVQQQLRSMVYEITSSAINRFKSAEFVNPKTIEALRNLISRYRMLDPLNDTEMKKELDELEGQIDKAPEKRSMEEITTQLKVMQKMSHATLIDLGMSQRQIRKMAMKSSTDDTNAMPTMARKARPRGMAFAKEA
jgi:cob(I)alamin adenosyltransferase